MDQNAAAHESPGNLQEMAPEEGESRESRLSDTEADGRQREVLISTYERVLLCDLLDEAIDPELRRRSVQPPHILKRYKDILKKLTT